MNEAAFIVLLHLFKEMNEGDKGDGLSAEDGGNEEDEDEEHV